MSANVALKCTYLQLTIVFVVDKPMCQQIFQGGGGSFWFKVVTFEKPVMTFKEDIFPNFFGITIYGASPSSNRRLR